MVCTVDVSYVNESHTHLLKREQNQPTWPTNVVNVHIFSSACFSYLFYQHNKYIRNVRYNIKDVPFCTEFELFRTPAGS